ncbi:MAG TPA: phospholipase D-like domain-containing protein [Vicinamibacterales bacterium]|jgi:cardiolipin synthase|nr:phospholipase D-like domain-containing protein [Vicinamibacterales bacterium]
MWRPILRTLVVIGLILTIALGIAQDQEVLHIQSAYAASDPDFPAYVAALTGTALTSSNRLEVLVNGDQVFPSMLDAIERAQRRISFETYIYSGGEVANRFTGALEAAARRGVRCNLVFDALGSKDLPSDHLRRLRDAGCTVGIFNPPAWYALEEFNYRTHRKILTVDGAVGFIGGVGVADYWSGDAQDADHWRDTQIRIEGPAVRYLEGAFYENFSETTRPVTPRFEPPPAFPPTGSERTLVLWSSPSGGSSLMKLLFLLSIAGARRTLDICSPYFLTDESTMWAIERAVDRGVRVRILVEGDVTDAKPVKFASRAAYDHLLERGIAIHEYRPTMMHAKTMVADGTWSVVGSANFDNRSLELNDELNVGVSDAGLAARVTADFERDLRRSTRLELEEWRRRSRLEQIREKFWSMFGEVF